METLCRALASCQETHPLLGPGVAMEGSPWPCVGLGAAPSLQGDLGTPEDVPAHVPSCEEREFKYGFLPLGRL